MNGVVFGFSGVQARLIACSPADGSLDFYVACVVGIAVSRVPVERARLRARLSHPSCGEMGSR